MFFKKRKEKQLQERNEARAKVEKDFSDAILKADQLEDPAEKISTLQALKSQIESYLTNDAKGVAQKANKTEKRFSTGGDVTFWATLGASTMITGPVGWAIAGAGVLGYAGAEVIGAVRSNSILKKYKSENADHTRKLRNLQYSINELTETTIDNHIEEIVKSPFYMKLSSVPSLAKQFAAAADSLNVPRLPDNTAEKKTIAEWAEWSKEEAARLAGQAAKDGTAKPEEPKVEEKKPVYKPSDFSKLKGVLNKKNDPKA